MPQNYGWWSCGKADPFEPIRTCRQFLDDYEFWAGNALKNEWSLAFLPGGNGEQSDEMSRFAARIGEFEALRLGDTSVDWSEIGEREVMLVDGKPVPVTSLIFNARGNPFGQFLMVIFSFLYGMISWGFAYDGEMITYLGMTAPMALFALIAWLRHPFRGNRAEVAVNRISRREVGFMILLSLLVTLLFRWILAFFGTANLLPVPFR